MLWQKHTILRQRHGAAIIHVSAAVGAAVLAKYHRESIKLGSLWRMRTVGRVFAMATRVVVPAQHALRERGTLCRAHCAVLDASS